MANCIKLHQKDNVATMIARVWPDELCDIVDTEHCKIGQLCALDKVKFGHKIALADIPPHGEVIKLGAVIGKASQAILTGAHVHVHNVYSIEGSGRPSEAVQKEERS